MTGRHYFFSFLSFFFFFSFFPSLLTKGGDKFVHIYKLKAYISISSYLYSYIHEKTEFFIFST